jgi:S-adenosylmethionine decarboxylase
MSISSPRVGVAETRRDRIEPGRPNDAARATAAPPISSVKRLGRHAIVDVSNADGPLEEAEATALLTEIARACGVTLLRIVTHPFGEGHGLTAIAVLAESHISLHEWPEYRFVAFDIFVCGHADPGPAIALIRSHFPRAHVESQIIDRQTKWHEPQATLTA